MAERLFWNIKLRARYRDRFKLKQFLFTPVLLDNHQLDSNEKKIVKVLTEARLRKTLDPNFPFLSNGHTFGNLFVVYITRKKGTN